mmetsp:Transcript_105058/g.321997  ORF Transcript_105058/g.321997 Transcript_105058/m.321997 type:complete len:140 (-) Transcript_105058:210-629(-)|eukprot:CAMPEP_0198504678 /NCGR_PEP_ID=MMETSP1462-20131121/10620_1 /TAXON_ID=1333877 /ORGANISM="Brandtodinium nutriculum, Strain RCC3387" /LENGTH=139 /DNA_ID=CAMNT_0044233851 /DNA_START=100 /DNA_END=519 /DNA_ORIENTATION=+
MAHFEVAGPENDGSLAYRLEDYLLSGSFLMQLNAFVTQHADKFEDLQGGEHEHEWHDIFLEYERMLNDRVEAFLKAEGVTAEQAVEACMRAKAAGQEDYKFFEYLAAAMDYEKFRTVMLDFKVGRRDVSKWWKCFTREA